VLRCWFGDWREGFDGCVILEAGARKWGDHETVPGLVGKTIGPASTRFHHGYG
jgi:hypothetical protein